MLSKLRPTILLIICSTSVFASERKALTSGTSHTPKAFTNSDVVKLVKLGFAEDIVISKIRVEKNRRFDTSVEGLEMLKASHVSDNIIRVMISPDSADKEPTKAVATNVESAKESLALSPLFAREAYLFHERLNKLKEPDLSQEGFSHFQFESSQLEADLKRTKEFDLQTTGDQDLMEMLESAHFFVTHERAFMATALAKNQSSLGSLNMRSVGCLEAIESTIENRKYDPVGRLTKYCTVNQTVLDEMEKEQPTE